MDTSLFSPLAATAASVATGAIAWHRLYTGAVTSRFKVRRLRSKRWDKLVDSGKWRVATPLALQDAFFSAYGYELDDRHIRFCLGRSNPRALFRELRRTKGMVKLNDSGTAFVRWKGLKFRRLSYRAHSVVAFAASYLPFAVIMIGGSYMGAHMSKDALVWTVVLMFVSSVFNLLAAGWFEGAHRLVEALDERFPAWKPDAGAAEPVSETRPRIRSVSAAAPRRRASRNAGTDDAKAIGQSVQT